MMQTTQVWDLDDGAAGRRLHCPWDGSILVQRKVRSPLVVILDVASQVAVQRAFVPHDDVVEALAAHGANHAFNERILPGRPRRRQHILDTQRLRGTPKIGSIDRVAIPYNESRGGVPGPRLADLLCGPRRGPMRRDIHVDDAPSVVREHDEHKQHAERRRGDREEVD